MISSKIIGTGAFIPSISKENKDFLHEKFLNEDGSLFNATNDVIIEKFKSITGIVARRYAKPEYNTSDLAFFASQKAIEDSKINPEELDYIIVAHNFGDVNHGTVQSDLLPSLATRVKHKLGIENPNCVAFDILFGCPGWIEGVIHAQAFIKSGMAKKCLVVGAETLSRVVDKHDRDSMIFSDGAGATILEVTQELNEGILSYATQTYAKEEAYFLHYGNSFNSDIDKDTRYIKMLGRKIYEFSLVNVPIAMKSALDKSGVTIEDVKKIFIHQANEKMDEAIIKRFYRLFKKPVPDGVLPMSIHKLGNSSVATVPTLLDLVLKGEVKDQEVHKGDIVIFASVGSGMNINAIVYKF